MKAPDAGRFASRSIDNRSMAVIPKKLLTIGARFLSARAAMQLRRRRNADAQQRAVFDHLVPRLALGSFWQAGGVEAKMSYEAFRAKVPLQNYEDLAPQVERMKLGAADILWPGTCGIYAVSSGTTAGRTKYIPVTGAMLDHFRQAGVDSLFWYTARVGHSRVFRGRHLMLGGSSSLAPIPESKPFAASAGDLSGIAALNLPPWVERHLYEPGAKIAQMADWPAKIAAITERTARLDISLLAGIPSWILILAESLRANSSQGGARAPHLQAIWPHFECFVHGGVPISPYREELRSVLGPTVNFHEVYPASEAFIAAQDAEPEAGLRLMTGADIFFEFLPMADYDESRLSQLGAKAVPLSGVVAGLDYALVLTTPAGLARYVIGDVVRFVSTEPPRLTYVGRTRLQLSAFGEHVIEKEVTDALLEVCRRHGSTIVNFHVAPIFVDSDRGIDRGRHEWWVELKPGGSGDLAEAGLALELDAALKRMNEDYEAKRVGGGLAVPLVRLVPAGFFECWLRRHGKWGGQSKMPRCRSDRIIADELVGALQAASV